MTTATTLNSTSTSTAQPPPPSPSMVYEDMTPLFFTIVAYLSSDRKNKIPLHEITQIVSQNREALHQIQLLPLSKIKEQFNTLIISSDNQKLQKPIFLVLDHVYGISLLNSSAKSVLVQTNRDLPKIQEKLKSNLKQGISQVLAQAQGVLKAKEGCFNLEHLQTCLSTTDRILRQLNEYRNLKQYTDPLENEHILDLAIYHRRQHDPQQYPKIITDYPQVVQQIQSLQRELGQVSEAIMQLNALKLNLQEGQALFLSEEKKVIEPLQGRLIDAYSSPFYRAFAWHFWTMAWNSMNDPEVAAITGKIPNWDKAKHDEVDYTILNTLWPYYMGPDFEMIDWMLKTLKSMEPQRLKELEQKLQALEKDLNVNKESRFLDKDAKSQLQAIFLEETTELCLTATEPSYSTLSEIRAFLQSG